MNIIQAKLNSIHTSHTGLINTVLNNWFDAEYPTAYTNRDTDIADTIVWYTSRYTELYDYLVAGLASEATALESSLRSAVQAHIQARHITEMGISFGDLLITDFQDLFNGSPALSTYEGFVINSDMVDSVGVYYTGGSIENNTEPSQSEFDLIKPADHVLPGFISAIADKVSALGAYSFEQSAAVNIGIEFGVLPSGVGDMPTLPTWYTNSKFQDLIDEFSITSLQPPTT